MKSPVMTSERPPYDLLPVRLREPGVSDRSRPAADYRPRRRVKKLAARTTFPVAGQRIPSFHFVQMSTTAQPSSRWNSIGASAGVYVSIAAISLGSMNSSG